MRGRPSYRMKIEKKFPEVLSLISFHTQVRLHLVLFKNADSTMTLT